MVAVWVKLQTRWSLRNFTNFSEFVSFRTLGKGCFCFSKAFYTLLNCLKKIQVELEINIKIKIIAEVSLLKDNNFETNSSAGAIQGCFEKYLFGRFWQDVTKLQSRRSKADSEQFDLTLSLALYHWDVKKNIFIVSLTFLCC